MQLSKSLPPGFCPVLWPEPQGSAASVVSCLRLVGLGRIELPTSPLSGVRSSHLSYRPRLPSFAADGGAGTGGADRDRTDDLLIANQALSQTELQPRPRVEETNFFEVG